VPTSAAAAGGGASASIKELELIIKLLVLDIFAPPSNLLFLQPKKQEHPQQQANDDELQLQDSAEPCCSSHSSCSKGGTIPNLREKKIFTRSMSSCTLCCESSEDRSGLLTDKYKEGIDHGSMMLPSRKNPETHPGVLFV
jgi:hypothetical protein